MIASTLHSDRSVGSRLARVERQLAVHRLAASVVLVLVLAVLLTSMMVQDTQKDKDVIKCKRLEATQILCRQIVAEEFRVVNEEGQARGVLQATKDEAHLCLLDAKQRCRLIMKCLANGTAEIRILDSNQKIRYVVGCEEATGVCLSRVFDDAGFYAGMQGDKKTKGAVMGVGHKQDASPHAGLYTAQQGSSGLVVASKSKGTARVVFDPSERVFIGIKDEKDRPRIGMALSNEGATLEFQDETGRLRGAFGEEKHGGSLRLLGAKRNMLGLRAQGEKTELVMMDAAGAPRAVLGVDESRKGETALVLMDASGTARIACGIDKFNGCGLQVRDPSGKAVVGAYGREGGEAGVHVKDASGERAVLGMDSNKDTRFFVKDKQGKDIVGTSK